MMYDNDYGYDGGFPVGGYSMGGVEMGGKKTRKLTEWQQCQKKHGKDASLYYRKSKKTCGTKKSTKKVAAKKSTKKNTTLGSLRGRVGKKMTLKNRKLLAEWLTAHGAGIEAQCPHCEGSGPLSGFLGMLGLGDEEGGAWYDDLAHGFKQGVSLAAPFLPFIL